MKILFDSSYFFPLIKVKVEKSSPEIFSLLHQKDTFELQFSSITLFELSAKGARMIKSGKLTSNDVIEGINALLSWKKLSSILPWNGEVQRLAFDFRLDHSDFIDCLILASAIIHADVFISEDMTLKKLLETKWLNRVREINIEFEILNINQLKTKINEVKVNSERMSS
jgi:PIN domain nuclease of toxin-antitoxin system